MAWESAQHAESRAVDAAPRKRRSPAGARSLDRRSDQSEFVAFGIAHDRGSSTGEVFPLTHFAPAERHDPLDRGVDVLNEYVDVETNLADLRLVDGLKVEEGSLIGAERLKAQPSRAIRPRLDDSAVEDGGPEGRDGAGIVAVDRDRSPCTLGHETIFSAPGAPTAVAGVAQSGARA